MRSPWWLRACYAVLVISALALVTLVIGDVVYAFESEKDEHETHSHGFYGPIFDLAWIVFAPTFLITIVTGIGALAAGLIRSRPTLRRYGGVALAYGGAAIVLVLLVELLADP